MVHERPDRAPPTTLHVFARFCVREGEEEAVAAAIQEVLEPSRNEPGCLRAEAFRSTRGRHIMVIHSVWRDEMAFDEHAQNAPHASLHRQGRGAHQPPFGRDTYQVDGLSAHAQDAVGPSGPRPPGGRGGWASFTHRVDSNSWPSSARLRYVVQWNRSDRCAGRRARPGRPWHERRAPRSPSWPPPSRDVNSGGIAAARSRPLGEGRSGVGG